MTEHVRQQAMPVWDTHRIVGSRTMASSEVWRHGVYVGVLNFVGFVGISS